MGFEALVPVGRWRGFGGVTNFNGAGFECFSWAAGIGASTTYPAIFATSHVPTVHPIMAAKQGAAIDHITNGRFVLNVVTGWNLPEIEMFGVDLLDHETRYERAAEWLTIIRRLWTEHEEFDFDGRFYRIKKGSLAPKPIQHPHPVIMNAGGSDTGRRFAAKHADGLRQRHLARFCRREGAHGRLPARRPRGAGTRDPGVDQLLRRAG
jgi:alkanesulfonate monooxygenase SsuD/methylene tetrahydromethanopterin reductase-like flavin-dependent oxidoreductase (luciferase family)